MKFLAILFAALCSMPLALAQDASGCHDSPLVTRFPGAVILACDDKADNAYKTPIDKSDAKTIEGEYHQLHYSYPKTASKAQVVRNMHTAMQNAGYTFVYDSGALGDFTVHRGKTWIAFVINMANDYLQTVITETALTQDVVATAAAMSQGLTSSGHTIVNGILFDTGKAEVKSESAGALQEVVKLLQQDPRLKVYVVGHTDNVGALAGNIDLSRRRAEAVVQVLIKQYAVAPARLQSFGNGPYAPVASNDSEDGRSANRRVELVMQ